MLEVEKFMTKNIITVQPNTPVRHAMELLIEKSISGLPVVDEDMHMVGMISEKDMLKLLLEDVVTSQHVVADYMTRNVIAFSPKDSVIKVCEFFMSSPIRRVPIVDEGKLVGVLSRRDIIKLILKIRNSN